MVKAELNRFHQSWDSSIRYAFAFEVSPEKREKFDQIKLKTKTPSSLYFHGSASKNFHSIIRNSLKNYSGTVNQVNGAAFGPGIYMGKNFMTSAGYCHNFSLFNGMPAWPVGSGFDQVDRVMVVTEVIHDQDLDTSVHAIGKDEDKIILRYLLLF